MDDAVRNRSLAEACGFPLAVVNRMLCVCALVVMTMTFAGCKHGGDEDWSGWHKIKEDALFSYMIYESKDTSDEKPLYVAVPGLDGGYENAVSPRLKKYLESRGLPGIIVAPYMDYSVDGGKFSFERCINTVENIRHDTSRVYLLGVSCGSVQLLVQGDRFGAAGMLLLVAGTYKAGGGLPTDELQAPGVDSVWFLNGFDTSVYNKYGILYDGTVYVDPVRKLVEDTGGDMKLTLFPGLDHGTTVNALDKSTEYFDWLTSLSN